jgi:hypothetical protein
MTSCAKVPTQPIIDSGQDIITRENVEAYAEKWKTGKF